MKPVPFEYHRPDSIGEVLDLLDRHGPEAKILAGGQSLVPMMNYRLARPAHLVDINGLDELAYIRADDGHLAIGALTRQSDVEDSPEVARQCPLLVEATRLIAHRTIRHRGTVGGSVAHADPAAEYPAALLALDGEVVVRGSDGERTIAAEDLFVNPLTTSIRGDELLAEVRVPTVAPRTGVAFEEMVRRHGDYALVGVAASVSVDENGSCTRARIALTGVDATPVRCHQAESLLSGRVPDDAARREVAAACAADTDPPTDIHASSAYRKAMVEVFARRALEKAVDRTGAR